jgi:hypothetical protein
MGLNLHVAQGCAFAFVPWARESMMEFTMAS